MQAVFVYHTRSSTAVFGDAFVWRTVEFWQLLGNCSPGSPDQGHFVLYVHSFSPLYISIWDQPPPGLTCPPTSGDTDGHFLPFLTPGPRLLLLVASSDIVPFLLAATPHTRWDSRAHTVTQAFRHSLASADTISVAFHYMVQGWISGLETYQISTQGAAPPPPHLHTHTHTALSFTYNDGLFTRRSAAHVCGFKTTTKKSINWVQTQWWNDNLRFVDDLVFHGGTSWSGSSSPGLDLDVPWERPAADGAAAAAAAATFLLHSQARCLAHERHNENLN